MRAADVVDATYAALTAGDLDGARAWWAEDAVWHPPSSGSPWDGDLDRDGYLSMVTAWFREHPDYAAERVAVLEIGTDLTAMHVRSSNGRASGDVEGLMVWRVENDQIVECWAIPGDARARVGF